VAGGTDPDDDVGPRLGRKQRSGGRALFARRSTCGRPGPNRRLSLSCARPTCSLAPLRGTARLLRIGSGETHGPSVGPAGGGDQVATNNSPNNGGGPVKLALWSGALIQRLMFARGLEGKPISGARFRVSAYVERLQVLVTGSCRREGC